ncbi:Dirigent protein [Heracleum sosnowskyi]|uniref:Dirigent protein n=1 Tax=Heracleum sosnowskyi TaxID=360622 RepID=A0AAD8HMQ8_9APIA|nr:Dirigent protein [Heracleum sosnowskyi]
MTTKLYLSLLLVIFICSHSEASKLRTTTMTLYFQDRSGGPNATVVPITGLPGHLWSFFSFGTIFCADDPITEGLDKSSPEIARGQGIFVTSALDGSNTHVLISIVFTNSTKYNGSTLEVQGTSRQVDKVGEVAVVAGTGKFRFARGYATFETVYFDRSISYSVIRCNVTVKHF